LKVVQKSNSAKVQGMRWNIFLASPIENCSSVLELALAHWRPTGVSVLGKAPKATKRERPDSPEFQAAPPIWIKPQDLAPHAGNQLLWGLDDIQRFEDFKIQRQKLSTPIVLQ